MAIRNLIVMRHGESASAGPGGADKQRDLTQSGRNCANNAGRVLFQQGWNPDYILCSDSVRTQTTARFLCQGLSSSPPILYSQKLYLGGIDEIISIGSQVANEVWKLLILGHNPGFSEAVFFLAEEQVSLFPGEFVCLQLESGDGWGSVLSMQHSWSLAHL